MTGHREEFWRNEADHWRAQYNRLFGRIQVLEEDARRAQYDIPLPPEPPIGSRFDDGKKGPWMWRRQPDGWHCPREGCRNCPAPWDEVVDRLPLDRVLHLPDPAGGGQ